MTNWDGQGTREEVTEKEPLGTTEEVYAGALIGDTLPQDDARDWLATRAYAADDPDNLRYHDSALTGCTCQHDQAWHYANCPWAM